ncbi:MAG: S8 family serine peptidase [Ignavibacteriae bacterium]|nr:S8 family serine peptidase [Ignavibacteriota bacterium]
MRLRLHATLFLLLALSLSATAGEKIDARLQTSLQLISPTDELLVWVFFTDKGSHEHLKAAVPQNVVSERSLRRRLKARPAELAVDYTDLPVEQRYVEQLRPFVRRIRQISKWFNAASVVATKAQIEQIESSARVRKLELVTRFKRNSTEEQSAVVAKPTNIQHPASILSLDYGISFGQLNQINVPAIHNTGNYAQGVLVGVFDNGFRLLTHQAFDSIRSRIIRTYDFVDHKVSVVPNNPDPGFGAHGILTFSALAGYKPGQLIGPAFGANFILARTENDSSETPVEEDNWLAAIEWADSIGVDVTSTSLGYLTYDPPYPSWTWQNMNGNTTVITRACDMAVSKGIVVVNSAGNNGENTSRNTLNAPADGDSVLAIGAVNADGTKAGFSSMGPTTSVPPRIKPDVMAQGSSVYCASATDPTGYTYAGGTSLSCPLAAGVVALLLHAKPTANPVEIANALRQTASRSSSPDNYYGWGIINAVAARGTLLGVARDDLPTTYALMPSFPNPFNPKTTITYNLPQSSIVSLKIFNLLGQEVRTLVNEAQANGLKTTEWDATNNAGNSVASGTYIARLFAQSTSGSESFQSAIKFVYVR